MSNAHQSIIKIGAKDGINECKCKIEYVRNLVSLCVRRPKTSPPKPWLYQLLVKLSSNDALTDGQGRSHSEATKN